MAAESTVTLSLNTLQCNATSHSGGSDPYLWPAVVWIDTTTGNVGEAGIAASDAHNVLKKGMKPGDSITIETTVGVITATLPDVFANFDVIVAVEMFQGNQTPDAAVTAGYNAFQTSLQAGVESHLAALALPATRDQARQEITAAVTAAVKSAISNALSLFQKGEIELGILTLDTSIGNGFAPFQPLMSSNNVSLTIDNSSHGKAPTDSYLISGSVTAAPILCADQRIAVTQATQTCNTAKATFEKFQAEYAKAPPSARPEIEAEMIVAERDFQTAQKELNAANQALQACLDGN